MGELSRRAARLDRARADLDEASSIGARFDARPELLFELRGVDQKDLIARAGKGLPLVRKAPRPGRLLGEKGLSELFGIELAEPRHAKGRPQLMRKSRRSSRRNGSP